MTTKLTEITPEAEAKSQPSAEEEGREGASQNKEQKADHQTMDEMTTNAGKQVRTPDR